MRFSLFDLLAWITFLAICCALFLAGPLREQIPMPAPLMIVWIAAIILVQKCFSWPVVLGVSVFIGICVGFVGNLIAYTTSRIVNSLPMTDYVLIGTALHIVYGVLVWLAVAGADYGIQMAKHRVNRAD
jgi:hypothetical protein